MKTQQQSCSPIWIQWNTHSEFSHQTLPKFLWYLTKLISDKHLIFNKEHFCYNELFLMVYHVELSFKPESLMGSPSETYIV